MLGALDGTPHWDRTIGLSLVLGLASGLALAAFAARAARRPPLPAPALEALSPLHRSLLRAAVRGLIAAAVVVAAQAPGVVLRQHVFTVEMMMWAFVVGPAYLIGLTVLAAALVER